MQKKTTCVLRNAEHFRTCIYCIMFLYTVDLAIKNPFPDIVMQSQFSVEQKVSISYNLCKAFILGFYCYIFFKHGNSHYLIRCSCTSPQSDNECSAFE